VVVMMRVRLRMRVVVRISGGDDEWW